MNSEAKKGLARFFIVAVALYGVWFSLYKFWLEPNQTLDDLLIINLSFLASAALRGMGYQLIPDNFETTSIHTVGIDGTNGLWIGASCDGVSLFALFSIFVIAFPGPWKKKLWFIPLGIVAIHALNLLRIIGLLLVVYYFPDPDVLDFNHNYTFQLIMYALIFLLWYIWANRLSGSSFATRKTGHASS